MTQTDVYKPYKCTQPDCNKTYKNLNGLKYHIEHTHPNFFSALVKEGRTIGTIPGIKCELESGKMECKKYNG